MERSRLSTNILTKLRALTEIRQGLFTYTTGDEMTTDTRIVGPASYFPSIEKNYGKPVAHWFKVLDSVKNKKHMEQVTLLKSEHKIGHGHANALVAYYRAQQEA